MGKRHAKRARSTERQNTPVESIRHKDKRKNIPTEELRDFVADDEHAPRTMLYPRDPSLDPQLVWKGKDEQDHADLAVPVVPIYIQEKIHPLAIIDDVARPGRPLESAGRGHRREEEGQGGQVRHRADPVGAGDQPPRRLRPMGVPRNRRPVGRQERDT